MSIYGVGGLCIKIQGIVLLISDSFVEKNTESDTYLRISDNFEINHKKQSSRDIYNITIFKPSNKVYDFIFKNNCKVVNVIPHNDMMEINTDCTMWAFYENVNPWKDKIVIELTEIDSITPLINTTLSLLNSTPANGSSNINSGLKIIELVFNSNILESTVNTENISIYANGILVTDYTLSLNAKTISINITKNLKENASISILISELLKDEYGFGIIAGTVISFTTGELTPLEIISFYPENNAQNINVSDFALVEFNNDLDRNTVKNITIYLKSGIVINAIDFHTENDYIEIQHSESFNCEKLTISFWIKFKNLNNQYLISKNFYEGTIPFDIKLSNSKIVFSYFNTKLLSVESQIILENYLYFITCVYDGTKIKIYLNSILSNEQSIDMPLPANTHPVWIGKYSGNIESPIAFIGNIKIWNIDLSISQIKDIKIQIPILEESVILDLLFNDGSGIDTIDSSSFHNNGVLINGDDFSWSTLSNNTNVSSEITFESDKIVKLKPLSFMVANEHYSLYITKLIKDNYGNSLQEMLVKTFTTEDLSYGQECAYYDGNGPRSSIGTIFTGNINDNSFTILIKIKIIFFNTGTYIYSHGEDFSLRIESNNSISLYVKNNKLITIENLISTILFISVVKNKKNYTLYVFDEFENLINSQSVTYNSTDAWTGIGFNGISNNGTLVALFSIFLIYSYPKSAYQIMSLISGVNDEYLLLRKFLHDEKSGFVLTDYSKNQINGIVSNIDEQSFWNRSY